MTTIAFDGKILAADSRITAGDKIMSPQNKLYIYKNEAIAMAGDNTGSELLREEYTKRGKIEKWKTQFREDSVLIVVNSSEAKSYSKDSPGGELLDEKEAIGSGEDFANGCLRCGLNAHEAVEKTCGYDVHTGDGVYSISLQQLKDLPENFHGYWSKTYQDDISELINDKK